MVLSVKRNDCAINLVSNTFEFVFIQDILCCTYIVYHRNCYFYVGRFLYSCHPMVRVSNYSTSCHVWL